MAKKREKKSKARTRNDKRVKNLKVAHALIKYPTLYQAYQDVHPKASKQTAQHNAHKMINKEVLEEFRQAMQIEKLGEATKNNLQQIFYMVVARWTAGKESTKDMLDAAKQLTRLVKEFSDKVDVNHYPQDEKKLDEEINELYKRYAGSRN